MDVAQLETMMGEATHSVLFEESTQLRWVAEVKPGVTLPHVWKPSRAEGGRERKLMVQACRALRMQIKSFEEDFLAAKGHSPRGSERAPLASTYRQYRAWKRDIRDQAAAQIQGAARVRMAKKLQLGTSPRESAFDLNDAHIANLVNEKRRLKQQLKDYDARFLQENGRMPHKFEKEPIRHLYELYHGIKAQLASH